MKISEEKKAMISIIENESKLEGKIEGINESMVLAAKNAIQVGLPNETVKLISGLSENVKRRQRHPLAGQWVVCLRVVQLKKGFSNQRDESLSQRDE